MTQKQFRVKMVLKAAIARARLSPSLLLTGFRVQGLYVVMRSN